MRWLILLHRYLGIAVGWLLVVWCLSGVVMMYVGFPEVSLAERVRTLPELRLERCCSMDPTFGGVDVDSAHVEMLGAEPVLRVADAFGRTWALGLEDGRFIDGLSAADARAAADALGHGAKPAYLGVVERDQWTVTAQYEAHRPLHHFALEDDAGTEWYLSGTTGELVQMTTRTERFWNWLGSVPHWLYPTLLRQNGPLWVQAVIGTSLVGLFLTTLGLYIGVVRLKRRRSGRWSPYRGVALWHHLLGLGFGVLTLTWLASGLLSVNPWGLLESSGAGFERANLRGAELTLDDVRAWVERLGGEQAPPGTTRLELVPFAGALQVLAYDRTGNPTRLRADTHEPAPLDEAALADAAARLAPAERIQSAGLLTRGDEFYFDHHAQRAFPVYRVVLADADSTRYYIDAATGRLLQKVDSSRRWYRWLFEGMHRFDFTEVMRQRPLWDFLVIVLLAGVTGVCATGTYMGIRFLLR